jgi:hypothetical protein
MRDVVLTDDTVRGIELLASSLDWPCCVVDLGDAWTRRNCWSGAPTCCGFRLVRPQLGRVLRLPHRPRECAAHGLRDRAAPHRRTADHLTRAFDTARSIFADAEKVWRDRGVALRVFVEIA